MARRSLRHSAPSNNRDIVDYFVSSSAPTASASSQQTPPARPINPDALSFVDLPGEIRNQIYRQLLPDEGKKGYEDYGALRHDGTKTSASFMATCRQIHAEAASILYGSLDLARIEIEVWGDDHMSFLGYTTSLETATAANFSVLKRAKALDLYVRIFCEKSHEPTCGLQDAMFTILGNLQTGHKVRTLNVHIDVGEDEDTYHDMTPEPESYTLGGRLLSFSEKVMREFRRIKPEDISRAHVTAFLTDPLRMVRGISKGKETFSLHFIGQTGRPWRDIPGQVRDIVQNRSPVADYAIFSAYFQTLRQLKELIVNPESSPPQRGRRKPRQSEYVWGNGPENLVERAINELGAARIRGRARNFRAAHDKLVTTVDGMRAVKHDFVDCESYEQSERNEQWLREQVCLTEVLKSRLPAPDVDTSFFGYNLADGALREWQEHGRKEEKEAKKKRKADKEAKERASKKAKPSKSD